MYKRIKVKGKHLDTPQPVIYCVGVRTGAPPLEGLAGFYNVVHQFQEGGDFVSDSISRWLAR